MTRTLPALILRLLASTVTLAGLRFFNACAERLTPAAEPDPAALDADERTMFERGEEIHIVYGDDTATPMCPVKSFRYGSRVARYATCPDCLRAYHGKERAS